MLSKLLREDDYLKLQLIDLVRNKGYSIAGAARELDVGVRSAQEFLNRDKKWAKEWLDDYEAMELEGGVVAGIDLSRSEINTPCIEDISEEDRTNRVLPNITVKLGYKPEDVAFKKPPNTNLPPRTKDNSTLYDITLQCLKNINGEGYKILVIADTQCKPNEDLSYMTWIGKYIADKQPEVIVHIGDNYDCPSLSSYDKGKKSFEGRRLKADVDAGNEGLCLINDEILKIEGYNPRMVFCMGNHEDRLDRLTNDLPELSGYVGTDLLPLRDLGWEVVPFLKPVEIAGIFFVHYLANPFTGKPYGGSAMNQLKTVGRSFVVGHKQCLDVAIRPTIDGNHQLGIINGACYPFDEGYKGHQGNNHWRGLTMLHEAKDGFASPMFVSLDYLKSRYSK